MTRNGDDDSDNSSEKTAILDKEQTTLIRELQNAREQEACLIVIRGMPRGGHRFFLTQAEMTIGRDASAEIVVSDPSISRRHAKITKEPHGKARLTDLNSSNGTFVNDRKVAPGDSVLLAKEDMIKLGNSILKFLPAGQLETLMYGALRLDADTDALTMIYNKKYLLEALEAEFKRAKALHNDFSILFLDLDHFKKINDTYGHDAGDYVLREFATLIRAGYVRPKDVFARYGGEEFVILLASTSLADAAALAEKIRAAVQAHAFIYEGKRLTVTASLGAAELTADMGSAQTLLRAADKALYSAKMAGRNRVVGAS